MKYRTFLDLLLLVALLTTVVLMTIDNVEATPSNYTVNVEIETLITWVDYFSANDGFSFVNINGVRVITIHCVSEYYGFGQHVHIAAAPSEIYTFVLNFNISYSIDNITINGVNGYDTIDIGTDLLPYHIQHLNASFRIYENNALIANGYGLGTHILNLPCPSIPCPSIPCPSIPLPPPIFELPPPPILTPPTSRPVFFNHTPVFFNYTVLFPFFDFIDWLFLPFAQTIINILWIPLGILDFITNTLIGFWFFVDNHVVYTGLLGVLSFVYVFFEIPQVMLIMLLGLTLIVIKIYLKR